MSRGDTPKHKNDHDTAVCRGESGTQYRSLGSLRPSTGSGLRFARPAARGLTVGENSEHLFITELLLTSSLRLWAAGRDDSASYFLLNLIVCGSAPLNRLR